MLWFMVMRKHYFLGWQSHNARSKHIIFFSSVLIQPMGAIVQLVQTKGPWPYDPSGCST